MDNVVQNISMEDIVSSNFQVTPEEQQKIDSLVELIKKIGQVDPILVRPKNGKYEIVLGIDKYQAAKIAGLNNIPAIIKEVDDETFSKYLNIENKQITQNNLPAQTIEQQIKKDNLPSENWQNKTSIENSDIINLSELSKKEYERDDFKMNNEQLNNNMMTNNFEQPQMNNQSSQGPTFGGSFYPSLEDEPTNMNMMGGIPSQSTIHEVPTTNNNLIDLTDLSIDNVPVMPTPPTMNNQVPEVNPMNNIQMPQNDFGMNEPTMTPQPEMSGMAPLPTMEQPQAFQPTDNIINLEALQTNNPPIQPMSEPTTMTSFNSDFGVPTSMPTSLDVPQNIAPQTPGVPEINPMNNIQMPQNDFGMNGPTPMTQPEIPGMAIPSNPEPVSIPNFNNDFTVPTPMSTPTPVIEPMKDITPVTNTIKNLVSSLETFGYKINIIEEELPTSIKLTIEVEK